MILMLRYRFRWLLRRNSHWFNNQTLQMMTASDDYFKYYDNNIQTFITDLDFFKIGSFYSFPYLPIDSTSLYASTLFYPFEKIWNSFFILSKYFNDYYVSQGIFERFLNSVSSSITLLLCSWVGVGHLSDIYSSDLLRYMFSTIGCGLSLWKSPLD